MKRGRHRDNWSPPISVTSRSDDGRGGCPAESGDGRGGWIIDGEWQTEEYLGLDAYPDLVIRVPVPRRSPAERGGDPSAAPADVVD